MFFIHSEYELFVKYLQANIFSLSVACTFILLMSFEEQMFLILMKSKTSFFLLWLVLFFLSK